MNDSKTCIKLSSERKIQKSDLQQHSSSREKALPRKILRIPEIFIGEEGK